MTLHRNTIPGLRVINVEDYTYSDEEPMDEIPATRFQRKVLTQLKALTTGQAELTVCFGKLLPRVEQLEADAKWKTRAVTIAKALAPFVGGLVVARFPQFAGLVGDILKAIGTAAATGGVPMP